MSGEEFTAGLHRHTQRIKEKYPRPLDCLLIEMAERNREEWLQGVKADTIGADSVRRTGLTSTQLEFAEEISEKLEDREEWACEECGENAITAYKGGLGRCNACIFGEDDE